MRGMMVAAAAAASLCAMGAAETTESVFNIPVMQMVANGGTTTTLEKYRGKVLLIVNVASKCGFTPQYKALEETNRKYADKGLQVLGFPSNDFGHQEPGTESEIVEFCKSKFDVTFPLLAKVHTNGPDTAPIYVFLKSHAPEKGDVKWNFEKFLIGRDGQVVARFRSPLKPDSPEVTSAIERELAKGT